MAMIGEEAVAFGIGTISDSARQALNFRPRFVTVRPLFAEIGEGCCFCVIVAVGTVLIASFVLHEPSKIDISQNI